MQPQSMIVQYKLLLLYHITDEYYFKTEAGEKINMELYRETCT